MAAPRCFAGLRGSIALLRRRLGWLTDFRYRHPRSRLLDRRLAAADFATERTALSKQPPINSIPPLVPQGKFARPDKGVQKPVQCFGGQMYQGANFSTVKALMTCPAKGEHHLLMIGHGLEKRPISAQQPIGKMDHSVSIPGRIDPGRMSQSGKSVLRRGSGFRGDPRRRRFWGRQENGCCFSEIAAFRPEMPKRRVVMGAIYTALHRLLLFLGTPHRQRLVLPRKARRLTCNR